MNKFLAVGVLSLAVLSIIGTTTVFAASSPSEGNLPPIVEQMVEKFNLDREEVVKELEIPNGEYRGMRKGEQRHPEECLTQAVEEGKLSESQKEELLSKHEEFKQEMQSSDLNWEDRREKMSNFREEMQNWMEERGIELDSFGFPGGHSERKGMHPGNGDYFSGE